MDEQQTASDPAELFVRRVVRRARNNVLADIHEELERGPGGRSPDPARGARHEWFRTLEDETKDRVLGVALDAIDQALFGAMVVLDGASGGYAVPEEPSDFALYLQTYDDDEKLWEGAPSRKVRINHPMADEDLHDLYTWLVEEARREQGG